MQYMSDSQNRRVVDVEWEAVGGYNEGAFVVAASYLDCPNWIHRIKAMITGVQCKCYAPVPDHELEYLSDTYPEEGDEHVRDAMIGAAEAYYEGDR